MTEFEKEIALIEKMGIAFLDRLQFKKENATLEVLIGAIFTCRHRRVSG